MIANIFTNDANFVPATTEIISINDLNSLIQKTQTEIDQFEKEYGAVEINAATKEGYSEAQGHWRKVREIRLAFQKKADATIKDMYGQYKTAKESVDQIKSKAQYQEDRFKSALDAEDQRKADDKKAKEDAERNRINVLRFKLEALKNVPVNELNANTDRLKEVLENLIRINTGVEEFQEFQEEAHQVLTDTTQRVTEMLRVKTEQAEIKRQQEEENARLAKERQEFEEQKAKEREAQEAKERELKAKREKEESERQAEIKRQQEEIDRQRKELEAKQAEEVRKEREKAEAEARAKREAEAEAQRVAAENARLERLAEEDEAAEHYMLMIENMSNEEAWAAVYDALVWNRIEYAKDIAGIFVQIARNK